MVCSAATSLPQLCLTKWRPGAPTTLPADARLQAMQAQWGMPCRTGMSRSAEATVPTGKASAALQEHGSPRAATVSGRSRGRSLRPPRAPRRQRVADGPDDPMDRVRWLMPRSAAWPPLPSTAAGPDARERLDARELRALGGRSRACAGVACKAGGARGMGRLPFPRALRARDRASMRPDTLEGDKGCPCGGRIDPRPRPTVWWAGGPRWASGSGLRLRGRALRNTRGGIEPNQRSRFTARGATPRGGPPPPLMAPGRSCGRLRARVLDGHAATLGRACGGSTKAVACDATGSPLPLRV